MSKEFQNWFIFVFLGVIWGTSFLWIKIGVEDMGPFSLVALRLFFGLLGLVFIMLISRKTFSFWRQKGWAFAFMGAINVVIPFILISWGEIQVSSGLTSVLNGTMPLFTIIIAHNWLHDEKITPMRILGLVIGFIGIIVLLSKDLFQHDLIHEMLQPGNTLLGQLAIIIGAICYAVATTFSRRYLRNQPPLIQSTLMMFYANIFIWPIALCVQRPFLLPTTPLAWISVIWLGVLGSCISYVVYFRLLNEWGATRSSLITYVIPIMGLLLGVIFLHEVFDWNIIIGTLLIFSGVLLVNWKKNKT